MVVVVVGKGGVSRVVGLCPSKVHVVHDGCCLACKGYTHHCSQDAIV